MTLSIAEIFLIAWALLMTFLWVRSVDDFVSFKRVTVYHLRRLHNKEVTLVDTGSAFIFEEIKV
jgi:hypothetical protein